jgi:uncharacterized membrane protein
MFETQPYLLKSIRLISVYLLYTGILLGGFAMLQITLPYFSFATDIGFLLTKQSVLYSKIWRLAFYTHIATSVFVLLFGLVQFVKPVLLKQVAIHRLLGKIYILLVLFISAPSGFIMALYANGGWLAKTSFAIISVLWWIFTYKAYNAIRNRDVDLHIAFMTRSYALTLSAITLRLYVLILPFFFLLHAKEMYTLVSWLSWVPNLLIAEWIIRKKVITAEPAPAVQSSPQD